jgi:hypothetical protein
MACLINALPDRIEGGLLGSWTDTAGVCWTRPHRLKGMFPLSEDSKERAGHVHHLDKCFAIKETVGGRDRDRTGDPLLANQRGCVTVIWNQ